MSNTRPLTDEEQNELDALTAAITGAIEARRAWLDAKMQECSRLRVGDDIYDLDSGTKLGTVSELYRYWRDRNDLLDTSHYCDYRYGSNNTSSQPGRSFGTREDALARAEWRASALRSSLT